MREQEMPELPKIIQGGGILHFFLSKQKSPQIGTRSRVQYKIVMLHFISKCAFEKVGFDEKAFHPEIDCNSNTEES